MHNEQVNKIIGILNATWSGPPLDDVAAAMYGSALTKLEFEPVMKRLRELSCTEEWRPSLALLIRPFWGPSGDPSTPSPAKAFARVMAQCSKRPQRASPIEYKAVGMLGGWSVIGKWTDTGRPINERRFATVYSELVKAATPDELAANADFVQTQEAEETAFLDRRRAEIAAREEQAARPALREVNPMTAEELSRAAKLALEHLADEKEPPFGDNREEGPPKGDDPAPTHAGSGGEIRKIFERFIIDPSKPVGQRSENKTADEPGEPGDEWSDILGDPKKKDDQ